MLIKLAIFLTCLAGLVVIMLFTYALCVAAFSADDNIEKAFVEGEKQKHSGGTTNGG